MKRLIFMALFALAIGQWLCSGCRRSDNMTAQSQGSNTTHPNRTPETRASPYAPQSGDKEHRQPIDPIVEQHWKEAEEMMRTGRGRKIEKRLPNPMVHIFQVSNIGPVPFSVPAENYGD
jgi:hypothetical protein